ncbi:MAG: sigma-54-dependent transcriptional regulator [Planctomycetota bacterium]|nr:sigma-54 dependent transcriptional regulator [Planctomycetota bacterium]
MQILLADDERSIAVTLGDSLKDAGHSVELVDNGNTALDRLRRQRYDLLITDIRMPGKDGIELLKAAKGLGADIEVIVITGHGTIPTAVEAIRHGAYDYVLKPFLNEDLVARVRTLAEFRRMKSEVDGVKPSSPAQLRGRIVGESDAMREVLDLVRRIAPSDEDVLIEGETGTGKERVAKLVHDLSPRKDGSFVVLSCSAFPSTLLEDEIFGHERGAFTDARSQKLGRFERANDGTLFLDDIDDVPVETQVKLLRILQERSLERLGGEKTLSIDVRVIAASKMDLRLAVEDGDFREDLFHRINVIPVRLPPLRERRSDIPLLVKHFVTLYGHGREYVIEEATQRALLAYDWPGNVRELENSVRRAIAMAGEATTLALEHLLVGAPRVRRTGPGDDGAVDRTLREIVRESEARHIRSVLKHTGFHRANAAKILGISRKNLWEKMREYSITDQQA